MRFPPLGGSFAESRDVVKVQFSDERSPVTGVANVNAVLRAVGFMQARF